MFSQGIQDPVRSNFVAGQTAAELSDNVPLTVLIGRAELLERGSNATVGDARTSPMLHRRISRPVLSVPTTDNDENPFDDEMAVLAIKDTYRRDPNQRGLTCYVCFRTGHAWIDCPCLKHMSSQEREDMAYRRRSFFEKKNHPVNSTSRDRPGWDTTQ